MVGILFIVAITDLWVAIVTSILILVPSNSMSNCLVAWVLGGSGCLITYAIAGPLVMLLIEVAISRTVIRSLPHGTLTLISHLVPHLHRFQDEELDSSPHVEQP